MTPPVFRFAPSPNGHLHLGHALSALLNARAARATGGRFLVRIEDIDQTRCTPQLEAEMLEDLDWLGLPYERPVFRQSEHFADYADALASLEARGLVYRGYLTRAEIKRHVAAEEQAGRSWPRDPDGAPLYPRDRDVLPPEELVDRAASQAPYAVRLDMAKALAVAGKDLIWREYPSELAADGGLTANWDEPEIISADPAAWGDVVLARKDTPTSYHLSVVIDDERQGITDVLRGRDLYAATSVHRLLQRLLELPEPKYRHHRLILGEDGRKLSKSGKDTSLRELRERGWTVPSLLTAIGLS
ncbi:tRNA glutamyl-Q(34) synthetase GluQRS [Roseibium litorale]|uniref:tRNA glutamyl-Q(34) synthetase GluQRS n=1 Tax=Roseibium litorale TaxID=2803841 RepID=A0ABR9CND5_9HYPH|nr:tRNA glutamyl-Q(34) synthetase GluQRS [Roseibium litorale]MBD8892124.1 tRNA glutamyl-Q(34) synthetase GluQRS [Roseibium litorale]